LEEEIGLPLIDPSDAFADDDIPFWLW
jgi:hypothetical protein